MKNWSTHVVRVVGALNLTYGLLGAALLLNEVVRYSSRIHNSVKFPYERTYYELCTGINAVFLVGLVLAGYCVILSNFVYSFEILYFLVADMISLALIMSPNKVKQSIGFSMAGQSGNMGIALQVITWYPEIALIVLNIARRRMNRDGKWRLAQGTASEDGSSLPSCPGV